MEIPLAFIMLDIFDESVRRGVAYNNLSELLGLYPDGFDFFVEHLRLRATAFKVEESHRFVVGIHDPNGLIIMSFNFAVSDLIFNDMLMDLRYRP